MIIRRTFLLALAGASAALIASPSAEDEAQKAAEAWLKLVDSGDYGASWDEAAPAFQEKVPRERWVSMVDGVRKPLGEVRSRSLAALTATSSLPGAPDGEYVVIQYKTEFAGKAGAVETITPMKAPDGSWRVSGYFIR